MFYEMPSADSCIIVVHRGRRQTAVTLQTELKVVKLRKHR